jgi:hypothetical protein
LPERAEPIPVQASPRELRRTHLSFAGSPPGTRRKRSSSIRVSGRIGGMASTPEAAARYRQT